MASVVTDAIAHAVSGVVDSMAQSEKQKQDDALRNAGLEEYILNTKYEDGWAAISTSLKARTQMQYNGPGLKYNVGGQDIFLNGPQHASQALGEALGMPTQGQVEVPAGSCHPGGYVADKFGNTHKITFRYGKAVYKMWGMFLHLPEYGLDNVFHTSARVPLMPARSDLSPCASMPTCALKKMCGTLKAPKRRTRC